MGVVKEVASSLASKLEPARVGIPYLDLVISWRLCNFRKLQRVDKFRRLLQTFLRWGLRAATSASRQSRASRTTLSQQSGDNGATVIQGFYIHHCTKAAGSKPIRPMSAHHSQKKMGGGQALFTGCDQLLPGMASATLPGGTTRDGNYFFLAAMIS
jgi:hypothetical protein